MHKFRKWTAWLGAGAIVLTLSAGCPGPNDTAAENVADATADTTTNVADAAADTTTNVADAAGDTTSNVGDAMVPDTTGNVISNSSDAAADTTSNVVSGAGNEMSNMADAATMTPKIKTALGANAALAGSNINVDTLGSKDTIALRGTVKSAAQKTLAESIAKKNAPGYKIANQLTMGGKM